MPYRTSTMAWLDFCMFWLGFVCPRSHPGWIGPIGEFMAAAFKQQQAYRYSIPLPTDLPSILRHGLAFLSKIVPVGWCDSFFVCFDWVLYAPGRIPAELGQLANLKELYLNDNQFTGNHPFFPPDLHSIWRNRLVFFRPVRTSQIGWLVFCMFWLSFVYPRSHSGWIGPIGQFNASLFTSKPAYRYFIPIFSYLPSI